MSAGLPARARTRSEIELDVVRRFDFNWVVKLSDVWSDDVDDVEDLHADARALFREKLDALAEDPSPNSPLGWVLVGRGGVGKTHLLGRFRALANQRGAAFVLVDMTDVHDFWETVLQAYIDALDTPRGGSGGESSQLRHLLRGAIAGLNPKPSADAILRTLAGKDARALGNNINILLSFIVKKYGRLSIHQMDVVRALICANSDDHGVQSIGQTWMMGQPIEDSDRAALKFAFKQKQPIQIVESLSWFFSLVGPTVLAFDQLDTIVAQYGAIDSALVSGPDAEERNASLRIIQRVGSGLGSLRDHTVRTLPVVCCIEDTWNLLNRTVQRAFLDRFERPTTLKSAGIESIARRLVQRKTSRAYETAGFPAPYPTWPFREEAFRNLSSVTPREVLQRCGEHRQNWLSRREVVEVSSLGGDPPDPTPTAAPDDAFARLDRRLEALRQQADPDKILEEAEEDARLVPLLESAMSGLLREVEPPPGTHLAVEECFPGGDKNKSLHVRLKWIDQNRNDHETHYCLRAIQATNAKTYQARLKSAIVQSGIDHRLRFRKLAIVRSRPIPGGAVTTKLTEHFETLGGLFVNPKPDDLRTLRALRVMLEENDADLERWLRARRPISSLELIREALTNAPFLSPPANGEPASQPGAARAVPESPPATSAPPQTSAPPPAPATANRPDPQIPPSAPETSSAPTPASPGARSSSEIGDGWKTELRLGRRLAGGGTGEWFALPARALEKHAVVLAGAGSGKTVLLRRLIEQAALAGIPSIVFDAANDLSTLGDPWPTDSPNPPSREPEELDDARRYFETAEVVVWTPGREIGNPMALEPLPDLAAVADDPDELEGAIQMVSDSLGRLAAPGNSRSAKNQRGILVKALREFAKSGRSGLEPFIDYLADLPPESRLGVEREPELALKMADALRVEREKDPLLRSSGPAMDPGILLGVDPAPKAAAGAANPRPRKTRVSIVNAIGLQSLESRQSFLNQLALTLFAWIKRHPDPSPRPMRGLLVIDEAKDYAPANQSTPCGESLLRLAAQARKYRLGLILATQNPKDLDHRIVSNASTHFYGKVNSPAAIDTIRELMRAKGGDGGDVAKLAIGQFHVHNADANLRAPVKLQAPMSFSHHTSSPPAPEQILAKALASRERRSNG